MGSEIRILIAEDLPSDASLAEREILKVLPSVTFKRVETKEDFIAALEEFKPDLVVSDYQMPSFDGLAALKITLEKTPVTPFIIHTGSMNEDTAVACMKAGATDYVIKEHMKRLGPAVKNALENKKVRIEHIEAHKALVKNEQLMKIAGRLAHLGGWSVDIEANRVTWSDEVAAIHEMPLGYSPTVEEGIGFYAPESRERITEVYTACASDGVPYDEELQIITGKGKRVWVRTIGVAIRDKSGKIVSVQGGFQDISERKNTENALRESELKFRHLVQGSKDIISMYDVQGTVLYKSPGLKSILGYEPDEVTGKSVFTLVHPDDKAKAYERLKSIVSMPAGESKRFEIRTLHKNGSTRWLDATITNMLNQPGVDAIVGNYRDITEQYRTELIQQAQYNIARSFITAGRVDDLVQAIWKELSKVVDAENLVVAFYNTQNDTLSASFEQSQVTKAPKEWPASDSLTGMVIREKKPMLLKKAQILKLAERGKIKLRGVRAETWLGLPLIIDNSAIGALVFQNYDNPEAFDKTDFKLLEIIASELSTFIDKKRHEEALVTAKEKAEESNRLKSAFLANVSHEIRTPMNSILGFLDLIKEPKLDDLQKTGFIDIVNKSAQRLLATINDIVELAKLESGQSEVLMQDVDISSLMQNQYNLHKPDAELKGLAFRFSDMIHGQPLHILSDKQKLSSILENLLNNAIKFTHQGNIEFGNYLEKDQIVFFVKDTGVGIPENKLEAIFERFVQADPEITRGHEGSGLGLSIARAYLNLLDGNIWVESEQGKGSTFYFSLPARHSIKEKKAQAENNVPVAASIEGNTILIAEDDDLSYLFLETILEGQGLTLLRAISGEEVVKLLKEHPEASLILMDLKMPGMGGLAAACEIRKFNTTIPIIAQTAHALMGDKATAIEYGCDDYISKPINRKELIRMINQYVHKDSNIVKS